MFGMAVSDSTENGREHIIWTGRRADDDAAHQPVNAMEGLSWWTFEGGLDWWLPGIALAVALHAACVALHVVLPATHVSGYVVDPATGKPFAYRLNGLRAQVAVSALWFALHRGLVLPPAFIVALFGGVEHNWATLAVDRFPAVALASFAVGLLVSWYFVWRARAYGLVDTSLRATTRDQVAPAPAAKAASQEADDAAFAAKLASEAAAEATRRSSRRHAASRSADAALSMSPSPPKGAVRRAVRTPSLSPAPTKKSNNDVDAALPPVVCPTSGPAAFFLGLEFNPRVVLLGKEVDVKLWLYLVGAVVLQCVEH